MKPKLLGISAAFMLMLTVAAGCTEKNRPNTAQPGTSAAAAAATERASPAGATGTSIAGTSATGAPAAASNSSRAPTVTTTASTTTSATNDAVSVVKQLRPSVVRVRTQASQTGPFGTTQQAQGTGTGVIVDTDGHIVTNNHVVTLGTNQVASNFVVDLADGRSNIPAKLVGREPAADLAILQINEPNLTPAKWADPKSIQVGQDVVAIGYALNLGATPTVTKGVVSALDRQITETIQSNNGPFSVGTPNFVGGAIQTDTPINPGNSGGPLVNMNGEVVGINTAGIFSQNGQPVQGINFAISVETVAPVMQALIQNGRIDRGYLGINAQPLSEDVAQAQHLPVNDGVGVVSVVRGSPADQAGLKANDIIVKLGDKEIHTYGDLQEVLLLNGPGTKLSVDFYRGNNKQTAQITLGSRPAGQQ